jgi:translation initiation factor IF-2
LTPGHEAFTDDIRGAKATDVAVIIIAVMIDHATNQRSYFACTSRQSTYSFAINKVDKTELILKESK